MHKCFLDIETTGLDINKTAVLEVGYLVVDDKNEVIKERHYTIKPEDIHVPYEWTQQAEEVNGISESQALNHEFDHLSFCNQMIKDVEEDFPEGPPVIYGFNIGFDHWMLQRMFQKHGLSSPVYYSLGDINSMSEVVINSKSSRKTAEILGVKVDEDKAHRAIYDCYLALECYKGIVNIETDRSVCEDLILTAKDQYKGKEWDCKEELFEFMHNFFKSL